MHFARECAGAHPLASIITFPSRLLYNAQFSMNNSLRVLYHDNCFDGLASAAVFSTFYRGKMSPGTEIEYEGLTHKAGQLIDEGAFGPSDNVIVDFKYAATPKLTWWFDHHQSAFLSQTDFEFWKGQKNERLIYDPEFRSCTCLISTVARNRFGYDPADLKELVKWAEIVDGALYSSAKEAVDLGAPAMQLTLVIEGSKGSDLVQRIIRAMQSMSLAEIMQLPEVQEQYRPLYQRHIRSVDIIKANS